MDQSAEVGRILNGLIVSLGSTARTKVAKTNSADSADTANTASGRLNV